MSVVTVRDGVMAVDSACTDNDDMMGCVRKWAEVPDKFGGGFAGGVGHIAVIQKVMAEFVESGTFTGLNEGSELVWLRADGSVSYLTNDGPIDGIEAEFFATGSGKSLARGAMAAGATAEEAANIACRFDVGCWGPVHVLTVNRT